MTSDPQDLGAPDLANRAWDPFWEMCSELQLPVHFHIGASITAMTFFGKYPWASQPDEHQARHRRHAAVHRQRARRRRTLILSGMFDRHPDLKMVSVESGVGWIPFILETLDYEMSENAPAELAQLKKMPSEYFRSNFYATFWFENNRNKLPGPHRRGRRGQHPVRDRLPAPDVPVPEPARDGRGEDGDADARDAAQDPRRERRELYRL